MSKVKIQGNASGTGVVTLTAPNTNTDRTITLPDGDITLGGGVDGIVSTANATAITIDASENVGIGTSSPTTKLNVGFAGADAVNTFRLEGSNGSSERFAFDIEADGGNSAVNFKVGSGGGAPTEKLRLTSDGRGLSQFTAKAWVNFRGTSTVLIRDSHNCSSIVDTGTGSYTVNFTNTMASDNYCGVATIDSHEDQEGGTTIGGGVRYSAPTYIRVFSRNRNGTDMYDQDMSVLVFGD